MINDKIITKIGWISAFMSIILYFSYIDQIRLNLAGHKGSIIIPLATIVTCSCWVTYGALKRPKDYPIIICHIIGMLVSTLAVITGVL